MKKGSILRDGDIRAAERVCSLLLGRNNSGGSLAVGMTGCCNVERGWIELRSSSGAAIRIAIEGENPPLLRYQRAVRIAARLSEISAENPPARLSGPAGSVSGAREAACLFREEGTVGRAYIALDGIESLPAELLSAECGSAALGRTFRVPLTLHACLPAEGLSKTGFIVSDGSCRWSLGGAAGNHRVIADRNGRYIMTAESILNTGFPVRVELGTVELSAQELLELRPGDVISIPEQESMVGTLTIAGEAWATVRVCRADGGVTITVVELCVPEATSSQTSR